MRKPAALFVIVVVIGLTGSARAEILRREPPMGSLKLGQVVLVDDGACPRGQLKQVTGGDHRKVGGSQLIERRRRCVAR
jgi:hypothetical protein